MMNDQQEKLNLHIIITQNLLELIVLQVQVAHQVVVLVLQVQALQDQIVQLRQVQILHQKLKQKLQQLKK
jgi:hypothetical protein